MQLLKRYVHLFLTIALILIKMKAVVMCSVSGSIFTGADASSSAFNTSKLWFIKARFEASGPKKAIANARVPRIDAVVFPTPSRTSVVFAMPLGIAIGMTSKRPRQYFVARGGAPNQLQPYAEPTDIIASLLQTTQNQMLVSTTTSPPHGCCANTL